MLRFPRILLCALLALAACTGGSPYGLPGPNVSTRPPAQPAAMGAPPPPAAPAQAADARIPQHVPTVTIALMLPLSGEQQALGKAMQDAASLALYDQYFTLRPAEIKAQVVVAPYDAGSSAGMVDQAAAEALKQPVAAVVGPVFAPLVKPVAVRAEKQGVPVISLSNHKGVASPGVIVFGYLPEQQVIRVAEFAVRQKMHSFAALLPNDQYGSTVADALHSALASKGIRTEPVEMYARTPANIKAAAQRLREGYDKAPFDALFIAEGGDTLEQLLAALDDAGLDRSKIKLVGTSQWDDPLVVSRKDMQGAWFVTGPAAPQKRFDQRFRATYGYAPPRLASLAYDAVALVAAQSLTLGKTHFSVDDFMTPAGFTGPATGLYRVHAGGLTERALSVVEIDSGGKVKMLDAAPILFSQDTP